MQVRLIREVERLAVLETPEDDEGRVEDRDGEREEREEEGDGRGRLQEALDRDAREQEAEKQGPRVPHEDPRGIEVVPQEAEADAGDDRREHRGLGFPSESAMMAKVTPEIPQTPAASPSSPSRKLTMFMIATIQSTVTGMPTHSGSW